MKLKTRIIVSFFAIIFVPLLLSAVSLAAFTQHQLNSLEEQYGIEDATYDILNSSALLSKMTKGTFEWLQEAAQEEPEKLEDKEKLAEIDERLNKQNSYLLVRKNREIYYCGALDEGSALLAELPKYGDFLAGSDKGLYIGGDDQALVKQVDFTFSDDSQGSVFIVTRADAVIPQVKSLTANMLFVVILILIITSLSLSFWTYRGVIAPLNLLKKATNNIKEGNLDFVVEGCDVVEINDLCQDFEEMRQRLKASTEEKVKFDKENKELISNIAHDLKTPITAVNGYAEGLMDGVANTPEKQERYIKTIYNKATEMDRLINELTVYSKIDTNRIPYTFSKVTVTEYFNDCAEDLAMELEAKGVELNYLNYVADDVKVIADVEQITRVINNIVSNSLKYMNKPKGVINLRVRDVGDFIQVEIEDNGKGIAQKDLVNIFERFYRTDASRNSSKGGSGIGLSIVKKIMEDHGGKVWATSKENIGTVMYFVLRKYQEVPVNE